MLTRNLLLHGNSLEALKMDAHSVYVVTLHLAGFLLRGKFINHYQLMVL